MEQNGFDVIDCPVVGLFKERTGDPRIDQQNIDAELEAMLHE